MSYAAAAAKGPKQTAEEVYSSFIAFLAPIKPLNSESL